MANEFISELNLEEVRAYFQITAEDEAAMREIGAPMVASVEAHLDRLYVHLLAFPALRACFPDPEAMARARAGQRGRYADLFSGSVDRGFLERGLEVGQAHDRIGLSPIHYMACYAFFFQHFVDLAMSLMPQRDPSTLVAGLKAAAKAMTLDIALAWTAFYRAREDRLQEDKAKLEGQQEDLQKLYRFAVGELEARQERIKGLEAEVARLRGEA